jgi:hypothetical protein
LASRLACRLWTAVNCGWCPGLAVPCLQLKQPAYAFEVGNKVAALNVLMQEVGPCS